jgi:hypothetical protein
MKEAVSLNPCALRVAEEPAEALEGITHDQPRVINSESAIALYGIG